ncbi:CoA transferase [Bradyrhizobium sp. STM 3561]|uniref:CoA transferase n=1 Tax=Bradyrhizobium sp. STM 3561 TaxID=578923 RepID=UPI00388DA1F0
MEAARVPCGPINTLDRVFDDPQVRHRQMCVSVAHPSGGDLRLVGSPMKFSAATVSEAQAPPALGQHTDAVLSELLGVPKDDIETLRLRGII